MLLDLLWKFLLTAASVWLVIELARRCGDRVAGMAAGLPVTTAPALILLGAERGSTFVAQAALGGLFAIGVCAMFAMVYAVVSRRAGPGSSLGVAGASAIGVALPMSQLGGSGPLAIALAFLTALILCAAVSAWVRFRTDEAPRAEAAGVGRLLVPLIVAGVSSAVCAASAGLPAVACGMLTGMPLVCAVLVVRQHRLGGRPSVMRVMLGYVDGLTTRTMFTVVVAAGAESVGWAGALALGALAWAATAFREVRRRLATPASTEAVASGA